MNDFNRWSLYSFLFLVSLPFLCSAFFKSIGLFLYVFDNVSIPVFMGVYSFFWIRFSRNIKNSEKKVARLTDEISSFQKNYSRNDFSKYVEDDEKLKKLEIEIFASKKNLEHINYALQFALIFWAFLKIAEFIFLILNNNKSQL